MQTLEIILSEHPFFKGLEKKYLSLITNCASNVYFKQGEFIFRDGESAERFYLIRHGLVSLEILSPSHGITTIQTLSEGEVLGFSWLFPPYKWCFDARVISCVRAISIEGKCIRQKCEKDHELGYELQKRFAHIMMQRLQSTRLQLLDLYNVPVKR